MNPSDWRAREGICCRGHSPDLGALLFEFCTLVGGGSHASSHQFIKPFTGDTPVCIGGLTVSHVVIPVPGHVFLAPFRVEVGFLVHSVVVQPAQRADNKESWRDKKERGVNDNAEDNEPELAAISVP